MNISILLREFMRDHFLTCAAVADLTTINMRTIQRIRTENYRCRLSTIRLLAERLPGFSDYLKSNSSSTKDNQTK